MVGIFKSVTMIFSYPYFSKSEYVILGWALLAVKIEISMNRLATFHKVGPGRGEHDGEKKFSDRITNMPRSSRA